MSHNTSMPDGLLPLFPLEAALSPHTPLPLYIFEDRNPQGGPAARSNGHGKHLPELTEPE